MQLPVGELDQLKAAKLLYYVISNVICLQDPPGACGILWYSASYRRTQPGAQDTSCTRISATSRALSRAKEFYLSKLCLGAEFAATLVSTCSFRVQDDFAVGKVNPKIQDIKYLIISYNIYNIYIYISVCPSAFVISSPKSLRQVWLQV